MDRNKKEPCRGTAQDKSKETEMDNCIVLERISGLLELNKKLTEVSKTIALGPESERILPYYQKVQEQLIEAIKEEAYSLRIE